MCFCGNALPYKLYKECLFYLADLKGEMQQLRQQTLKQEKVFVKILETGSQIDVHANSERRLIVNLGFG